MNAGAVMACDPITVRCSCGATIRCQHDAEADAVMPVHGGPECREACGAEFLAQCTQMAGHLLDLGARVDDGYLDVEIGETRCPRCRGIVRVDVPPVGWPRLVNRDGYLHHCGGIGVGQAAFDAEAAKFPRRPAASSRTSARTTRDTSSPPHDPGVEVPRIG